MSLSGLFRCALVPAAIFSLGAPQVLAQGETATIQGRVFLEGTRDPLVGALVRAVPPLFRPDGDRENMAVPIEGVTDKNGRFALNWMTSGIWDTTVSAEGFTDSTLRIEVSQSTANVCTATGMLHCNMPIEFYVARLKSGAELKIDQALGAVELPDDELEQAKADLIAADAAYNSKDYRTAIAGYHKVMAAYPQITTLHCTSSNQSRPMSSFRKRDFLPVTRLRRCV